MKGTGKAVPFWYMFMGLLIQSIWRKPFIHAILALSWLLSIGILVLRSNKWQTCQRNI